MLDELADKKKQAQDLKTLLASKTRLWNVVKQELRDLAKAYGDKTTDQGRASPGAKKSNSTRRPTSSKKTP